MTDQQTPLAGLDIRPATRSDAPHIIEMLMTLQQLTDSYPPAAFGKPDEDAQRDKLTHMLEQSLDSRIALILVATLNKQPVGTLSIYLSERRGYEYSKTGYLISVWVNEDLRRQGIARDMLNMAREWARHQGAQSLQVGWHPANPKASAFWQSQGFSGYEIIGAQPI